jgi:hypothetical protein
MTAYIIGNQVERFPWVGFGTFSNSGSVIVARNKITGCGYGAQLSSAGIAIALTSAPSCIEDNEIEGSVVPGSVAGQSFTSKTGIFLASSNVVVRANSVAGELSRAGLILSPNVLQSTTAYAVNNTFEKNRLTGVTPAFAQVLIEKGCDANDFRHNRYGPVATGGAAGMVVQASENEFVNEDFRGSYPGVNAPTPLPCVWLTSDSAANTLTAIKYQGSAAHTMCDQVLDQGAGNTLHGVERC